MKSLLFCFLGIAAGLVAVVASAQSGPGGVQDLGTRSFTTEDVIKALERRPQGEPVRKTRGLRGVEVKPAEGAAASSDSSAPRKLSMQLQFEFDSAALTDAARARLDAVGAAFTSPQLTAEKFIVSGHTDITGRYEYNLALSKRRAEAVKTYLVSRHGVAPERILPVGKASDELIDASDPASPANRRVQIETVN